MYVNCKINTLVEFICNGTTRYWKRLLCVVEEKSENSISVKLESYTDTFFNLLYKCRQGTKSFRHSIFFPRQWCDNPKFNTWIMVRIK